MNNIPDSFNNVKERVVADAYNAHYEIGWLERIAGDMFIPHLTVQ